MKFKTKLWSMLLTLALVLSFFMPVQAHAEDVAGFDLKDVSGKTIILHTNDTHGRVDKGINASQGIAAVAAFKKVCEEKGAQVILLDAGDTLHGKPIATINRGETIVELLNACGYDAMTLGNHDFNYGSARVLELEKKLDFPMLAANVSVTSDGKAFVENHIIIEKNGVTYGIFGLSTVETVTKTNPKNVASLTFADPIETAKAEVKALNELGADIIIALGHIGIDASSDPTSVDILEQVGGIDLFIDGHSHSTLLSCAEANTTDTLLVSTGEYLGSIGCVVVDKDKSMKAYSITEAELAAAGVKTVLEEGETEILVDETIGGILNLANEKLNESLKEVVATTKVYLDGVRENVRSKETNLGNLAADAIRWASNADVALTNGGGIRTSIEVGDITKGMLAEVFPFGNIVVSKKVTGQAIKDMLEHGVKDYPALSGGYPQTSGLSYTVDVTKEAGNRIYDLKVANKAIDLKATYILASNDFTIAGGDGYTMISDELFPTLYEFGALDEVLIHYLETKPSVSSYQVGRVNVLDTVTTTDPVVTEGEDEDTQAVIKTYTVVKGDFLRKIAKNLFGSEKEWKKIYEWNKASIKNPNLIFIGQVLLINE